MAKSPNEHAICLDGRELNAPIGKRIQSKDGNVVSLYGPTGFAYRVEHAHFDMKPTEILQPEIRRSLNKRLIATKQLQTQSDPI